MKLLLLIGLLLMSASSNADISVDQNAVKNFFLCQKIYGIKPYSDYVLERDYKDSDLAYVKMRDYIYRTYSKNDANKLINNGMNDGYRKIPRPDMPINKFVELCRETISTIGERY